VKGNGLKVEPSSCRLGSTEVIGPGLGVVYVPGEEDLKGCIRLGEKIAAQAFDPSTFAQRLTPFASRHFGLWTSQAVKDINRFKMKGETRW